MLSSFLCIVSRFFGELNGGGNGICFLVRCGVPPTWDEYRTTGVEFGREDESFSQVDLTELGPRKRTRPDKYALWFSEEISITAFPKIKAGSKINASPTALIRK